MSAATGQVVFITGATGFIGRHVIDETLTQGHRVIALVRQQPSAALQQQFPAIEFLVGDLTKDPLDLSGKNIDIVIHLAASMTGLAEAQFNATVSGTENLLNAMRYAKIKRLVGVSSISVLDYRRQAVLSDIDESVPLMGSTVNAGIYAQVKMEQENLFRQFAGEDDQQGIILRPGLVYDEQKLMTAHAGIIKGPIKLLVSHAGFVPVIHADSLARAIVKTIEIDIASGTILQLVDDNLPTQKTYLSALRQRGILSGGIALPWQVLGLISGTMSRLFGFIGLQGKLPEILLPQSFAARARPYRFSNEKARQLLHWTPNNYFK